MTKATFDREERYTVIKHKDLTVDDRAELDQLIQARHIPTRKCLVIEADWPEYEPAWRMIEARMTGAAPRQPEGDGLEVVAWLDEGSEQTDCTASRRVMMDWVNCDYPITQLCRLSDAQLGFAERDATIAELREECKHLKDCQENAMLHMTGLVAERDTLRQQLVEARDEITQHSNDLALAYMKGGADMRQQRDRLAELLRELYEAVGEFAWDSDLEQRIDASLAEVKQ